MLGGGLGLGLGLGLEQILRVRVRVCLGGERDGHATDTQSSHERSD